MQIMRGLQKVWILTFFHKIDPRLNQILKLFYVVPFIIQGPPTAIKIDLS